MLGQSKTAYQAEIDTPCELVDFWRFNVHFASRILADQPISAPGVWNRVDYRPLEGFVYAITPFNFSAIAGNLPTAPALMGNTVVWKPAVTQSVAAYWTMRLLEAAGLPPGVINMVHGAGPEVSEVALADHRLAGIHFTGSTATFRHLWRTVAANLDRYDSYPRLVGETGGKDFVVAHSSADPEVLSTATKARSARPPRALFSRDRCGTGWAASSSTEWPRSATATSPTSAISAERSSIGAPSSGTPTPWRAPRRPPA
jgi:1-pyrroline-5-carboxylate dehydrogenase